MIVARLAINHIIARTTQELIIALAAGNRIVASTAINHYTAVYGRGIDDVITRARKLTARRGQRCNGTVVVTTAILSGIAQHDNR